MGRQKGSKNKTKDQKPEITKTRKVKVPKKEERTVAFECLECKRKIYYKLGECSSDMAVSAIQTGCPKCGAIHTKLRDYLMKVGDSRVKPPAVKPPRTEKAPLSKVIKAKKKRKKTKKRGRDERD
jgi:PHP family Zn ribbon phosphoesterase